MWMFRTIFLFTLGFVIVPIHNVNIPDRDFNVTIFTIEIERWVNAGVRSSKLMRMINDLAISTELQREDWTILVDSDAKSLCMICRSFAKTIINLRRKGVPIEKIQTAIANLCIYLNLQSREVCYGAVTLNTPVLVYIIDNDSTINEDDVCSLVLQNQPCSVPTKRYDWSLDIDNKSPGSMNVTPSNNNIRILQLSDIHYDPLYEPGGNAICDDPTCCRKGQNRTESTTYAAGFWGDYNNCDSPWHAIVEALDHMKNHVNNLDLIYFTGDVIDHGIWATSRQSNIESLIKSFHKIKENFKNIPVYPILGNHEPHPLNLFAPADIQDDNLSTKWLYKLMANIWIDETGWLPDSTRNTIHRGGFYTVKIKTGLRIIAINNNLCYIYNWWLIYQPKDPYDQLKWLADTLLEAENNDEFVHILGHIPAGASQCQHTWSREYRKIINRFAHIITAQFNGHTHNDEFNVFYASNSTMNLINVAWNGGSLTPYSYLNPNYKIYMANTKTFAIEDAETWIYNLTEANETPEMRPNWYKSYSFKETYGLQNLSTDSLNQFILSMAKNSSVLQIYHRNFYKHAAPKLENSCDNSCLQKYICRIVKSSSDDNKDCQFFQTLIKGS